MWVGSEIDPRAKLFSNNLPVFFVQYAWTALHWASDKGHLDVVDHLLNCGAEPNAEDVRRKN